jgi:hypothetical protein
MKNTISYSIFLCAVALLVLPLRCIADTATCHVVDPAGKPIANATIYSILNENSEASTKTTDKSGNFTVDTAGNGEDRSYMIDAPGFAPGGGTVSVGENTFTLTLPKEITGKVVDSKGHPAAGVTVCAESAVTSDTNVANSALQRRSLFTIEPLFSRYTVKTDSTGTYTLDRLPAQSQITVQIKDPRFVAYEITSDAGAATAPSLTAEPSTSILGKVVRQDGKPVEAGIMATVASSGWNSGDIGWARAAVAADGTYKITGIAPGSYSVSTYSFTTKGAAQDWADAQPVKVSATIEAPGVAPDLVLTSGGIVNGAVLDADTKKPIANVDVNFSDTSDTDSTRFHEAITDADGKFSLHLWPGKSAAYLDNIPDDYLNDPNAQKITVTAVADQTVSMDAVLLKPTQVASGIAVDDSGSPIPNITLATQRVPQSGGWLIIPAATTSESGVFSIHGLVPGEFWIDPGVGWTLLSPRSFTVPLVSPLKLVVKKYATSIVHGTVVDTANSPVAGVTITYQISHAISTFSNERTFNFVDFSTGSDGTYTLPPIAVDVSMLQRQKVTKDGYIYRSGGDISVSNGNVIVSPIVMAQPHGKVDGIVYNGLGKPVVGAWVFSPDAGNDATPVQTDAAGHFELSNLIVGSVTIDAAKGAFFSRSTLQAAIVPIASVVRLSPVPTLPIGPANLSKAIAMLNKSIMEQMPLKDPDYETYFRYKAAHVIAEASPDAAVSFILSTASISTADLTNITSAKMDSDPLGVASWAITPIKRMSGNMYRGSAAASIGLGVAPYDAAAAAPYYSLAAQCIHFDHLDRYSIVDAMTLTALAYVLHKPEADDDYAKVSAGLDTLLEGSSKDDPVAADLAHWLPEKLAKIVALGNVDKAIAMLNAQPINNRYDNVRGIIAELVKPNPIAAIAL